MLAGEHSDAILAEFGYDGDAIATLRQRGTVWSDPAADIEGIDAFVEQKHWGCAGPLVIDARIKPHHAPPLVEDPEIVKRVDALAAPGGPLHGIV